MICAEKPTLDQTALEAVIYCRSAVGDKAIPAHIKTQENKCRSHAMQKGYRVTKVFRETGISSDIVDRPGIAELLVHLEARKMRKHGNGTVGDCIIIVDDICRLSRDLKTHVELRAAIEAAGGRIEYASFPMSDTPEDRLVESILIAKAQLEASLEDANDAGN